ncbi:hypothetical protein [Klebsiella pneumoniae]
MAATIPGIAKEKKTHRHPQVTAIHTSSGGTIIGANMVAAMLRGDLNQPVVDLRLVWLVVVTKEIYLNQVHGQGFALKVFALGRSWRAEDACNSA